MLDRQRTGAYRADPSIRIELPGKRLPGLRQNDKGEGQTAGDSKDGSKGKTVSLPSAKGRRVGDVIKIFVVTEPFKKARRQEK